MKLYLLGFAILLLGTAVASTIGQASTIANWTVLRGNWTITSAGLTGKGLSAEVVSTDSFPSDRTVNITMKTISTVATGSTCCPYYVARANGKFVDEYNKVFMDIWTTGILNLVITTSNTYTNNPVQTALSPFDSHNVRMAFLGDNVKTYVDGVLYFNVTDTRIGAMGNAQVALSSWGTSESTFQPVTVERAAPSPPPSGAGGLAVSLRVGTLYFPGDTAAIYVLTSQAGAPVSSPDLRLLVVLTTPSGSKVNFTLTSDTTGVFKANYTIPKTGSLGIYEVLATASLGTLKGSDLQTFEVKLSWLSVHAPIILSGATMASVIGVATVVWRKGYFRKNSENSL